MRTAREPFIPAVRQQDRSTIRRDFQLLAAAEPYEPMSILDEETQAEGTWDVETESTRPEGSVDRRDAD